VTVAGEDLGAYAEEPWLDGDALAWRDPGPSADETIVRPCSKPFQADGGMRLLEGNLGRACFKTSAVDPERWTIEAPCRIFDHQEDVAKAFAAGELDRDVVVVVRFQGPRANGMPELHKLTPVLGVLQDRGYRVALVTDGRMSGASGKVPAAIHLTPEAEDGGPLAYVRDGDIIRLDARKGELEIKVSPAELMSRERARRTERSDHGYGRELFGWMRQAAGRADAGACALFEAA
jgi:phosphogluconate dehydratase